MIFKVYSCSGVLTVCSRFSTKAVIYAGHVNTKILYQIDFSQAQTCWLYSQKKPRLTVQVILIRMLYNFVSALIKPKSTNLGIEKLMVSYSRFSAWPVLNEFTRHTVREERLSYNNIPPDQWGDKDTGLWHSDVPTLDIALITVTDTDLMINLHCTLDRN